MSESRYIFYQLILLPAVITVTVFAQEGYVLKNITFNGNDSFSSADLQDRVSMYTLSGFSQYIMGEDPYLISEDMLQADLKKLKYFYQEEGFVDVQLSYEFQAIDKDDRTSRINITIKEEKPVVVDSVFFILSEDINSNDRQSDSLLTQIAPDLQLRSGMRFRDVALKSDEKRLIQKYLNSGYPYVDIDAKITLSETQKTVNIRWNINPGPLSYFGEIQIAGSGKISESIILDQLAFAAGELYSQVLIDTSHRDIYSLGLYQMVSFKTILTPDQIPVIPVTISVKEAPQITTRFGLGYGSEDKFRAFAEIFKLSFLGGARRLNLYLRFSALEPYRVELQFTQPSFLIRSLDLILNPFTRKQDEPGFKVSRLGIRTTFLYPFPYNLNTSLSYTYEKVDQDTVDIDIDDSDYSDDYKGLYNKSMINLGLARDTSFPKFFPARGSMTSFNLQYNGLLTAVEYPFYKTVLDLRKYIAVAKRVLALRLKIGGIKPLSTDEFIPVEERFYSGGSYSVRGWARSELGPKNDKGTPLGGNSLIEISSELRYPIYGIVSGVTFIDGGNVWLDSYSYYFNDLRYSAGVGIRIRTPIGPVRFDMARPIFDEEKEFQFHFSIGHAF